jgi:Domain of unknown function (DUF4465)/Secretion system C-terminal sorting domain
MRKFCFIASTILLSMLAVTLKAQTVATFDTLPLAHADTFYSNYATPGADAGFNDGLAHFPFVWDTSGGFGYWSSGFVYSNMTDSVTPGYTNQYSAITASGYGGSAQYAVAYGTLDSIYLIGAAVGKPVAGFYITNSTYTYSSIKNGDAFERKFHDSDWYKVTITGYPSTDSVVFYLADYRFHDSDSNYVVKTWQWVNLLPLGNVNNLQFKLSSSLNNTYGMLTPAYFCIDNFTTDETVAVDNIVFSNTTNIYPNPCLNTLNVDLTNTSVSRIVIFDNTGKHIKSLTPIDKICNIDVAEFAPGNYIIALLGNSAPVYQKFIKY